MRDRTHEKTVSLKNEVYFTLKEIAKQDRRTIKETVSIILEDYIDKRKKETK